MTVGVVMVTPAVRDSHGEGDVEPLGLHQVDLAVEAAELDVVEGAGVGRHVGVDGVVDAQRDDVGAIAVHEVGDVEVKGRVAADGVLPDVLSVDPGIGDLVRALEFEEDLAVGIGIHGERAPIPAHIAVEGGLGLVVLAAVEVERGQLERVRDGDHLPGSVVEVGLRRLGHVAQVKAPANVEPQLRAAGDGIAKGKGTRVSHCASRESDEITNPKSARPRRMTAHSLCDLGSVIRDS